MCQKNPASTPFLLMISACHQKCIESFSRCAGGGFIVSGLHNSHSMKWPGSVFKSTGCVRRVAGQDVVVIADEVKAVMQAGEPFCNERILAAELSFVQITLTFVQHSKTE